MIDFKYERIFFDTAPYIYLLDYNDTYRENTIRIFEHCLSHEKQMLTSTVTIEEFCVKPYRDDDIKLIKDFKRFLIDTEIKIIQIDEEIAHKAAMIRAKYKSFKAMDSLQLAAAIIVGCDLFITNDKQLRQIKDLNILVISE